jgi:arabinofuranosyltransferase
VGSDFSRNSKLLLWPAAIVAAYALFCWEAYVSVRFVPDDSYITFSFSKNLATGQGPVYSHGLRVEGYSNFLWMVLVAASLRISPGADPIELARGIDLVFGALLIGATYLLGRSRAARGWALAGTLLLAIDIDLILAHHSGLETLPYTALITAGFLCLTQARTSRLAGALVIPVFTAASLMRIDGAILLAFVAVFHAATSLARREFSLRNELRFLAPGAVVWLGWFAWRYWYYGLLLPSTVYAKALIHVYMPARGPKYVASELLASGLVAALPAFGYLLWRRRWAAIPIGSFSIVQLVATALVGGDWMPDARFVLPVVPLLIVLIVWALDDLYAMTFGRGVLARAAMGTACAALMLFLAWRVEPHVTQVDHQRQKLSDAASTTRHVAGLKRAARYLAAAVPSGRRLVTDYGGVFAYYTDASLIEMWGLCNATIARRGHTELINPIYGRTCPECYPELDPEYFHIEAPLVRSPWAFVRDEDVLENIWQHESIGRYVDFVHGFVTGRVVNERRGDALWFLERRREGWTPNPRRQDSGMVIEYPFVPGGLLPVDAS